MLSIHMLERYGVQMGARHGTTSQDVTPFPAVGCRHQTPSPGLGRRRAYFAAPHLLRFLGFAAAPMARDGLDELELVVEGSVRMDRQST